MFNVARMDTVKKIRIVTHNGTFHVDDLFAVATLQLIHGEANTEVLRSRDPKVWETGDYVLDVGNIYDPARRRYDHHQHGGAGGRPNGAPYSALGLVWKHHGEELTKSKEIADMLDREIIAPIDMADNGIEVYAPIHEGVHPFLIHRVLVMMRPTWKEPEVHDERFMELLPMARRIMEREIISARDTIEGEAFVRDAYRSASDRRIVVLEKPYPWGGVLAKTPDAIYVVKPKSAGGDWEVECVRDDMHSFLNRKPLPENWRGYRNGELEKRTGVPGAVFCHNAGFIAVAKTKESALQLAELAIDA